MPLMTEAATDYDLTTAEREQARIYLHQSIDGLKGAIKGLTPEQWMYTPGPDCWSIAKIMEHVLLIYERATGAMKEKLADAPAPPANHDRSRIDAIVLGRFPNRIAKFSAPPFVQPNGCFQSVAEALAVLATTRTNLENYLDSAINMRAHALEALPLKTITQGADDLMDGYQWFLAANAHAERHTKQILEIRAHDDFPV